MLSLRNSSVCYSQFFIVLATHIKDQILVSKRSGCLGSGVCVLAREIVYRMFGVCILAREIVY